MNKKFDFTTMVPQVELFSFVFWENWRHQKDISKLTDLYDTSGRLVFIRFLGEIEDIKKDILKLADL